MIYLDNGATTPVLPEAAKAACSAMTELFGNPSSIHRVGSSAKALINEARTAALSAAPGFEAYFTSGGTESNNLAVSGTLRKLAKKGGKIAVSSVEHAAVSAVFAEWRDAFEIITLEPDKSGRITADEIAKKIDSSVVFVSLMLVNNETGAVNDLSSVRGILRSCGSDAVIHSDCVAAFGKVPLPRPADADLLSVSGHKIGASKGVGILYCKKGREPRPIVFGGGQEKSLRSGTENVPAIASLGVACKTVFSNFRSVTEHYCELYRYAVKRLSEINGVVINTPAESSGAIVNISLPGVPSEVTVRSLQDSDIYISPASACSSNKGGRSAVLAAMRLPPEVQKSAVRISFGRQNTLDEIDILTDTLAGIYNRYGRKK